MSRTKLTILAGFAVASIQALIPPSAHAVGNGVDFGFRETPIPGALMNAVFANSEDGTYHDCLDFTDADSFTERGYLWVSSYQDVDSVVPSQINHFLPNGYQKYLKYSYQADECSSQDTCNAGTRRNYGVNQAQVQLVLDPLQDTVLTIVNCQVQVANDADDILLGNANALEEGQKTETDDLINGDFELVFNDWNFTAAGAGLYKDLNGNPLPVHTFVLNGNVTRLRGPLGNDHRPEGSGNFFWKE
jgi:hypothetical protein